MISARGDATVIPQNRMIHVMFKNVQDGEVYFFINGERVNVQKRLSDCVSLKIPFGAGNIYQVSVVYNKRTDLELWQERAKQVLIEGEGANPEKLEVWKAILQANTIEECVSVVENSALTAVLKQRLKETLQ